MSVKGEVSAENLTALHIEWKFQNIFPLLKCTMGVRSPYFFFLGEKFCTGMYLYGDLKPGHIGLYLEKASVSEDIICVQYRIGIKKPDGTEFKCYSEEFTFQSIACASWIKGYVFIGDIQDQNVVGPDGVLTLFCTICSKKTGIVEVETQTELFEGLYEHVCENLSDSKTKANIEAGGEPLFSSSVGSYEHVGENLSDSETEDNIEAEVEPLFSSSVVGVKKLLENFEDLFVSEENCDVLIKVKEEEFKAHRTILGARSRVFSSMFIHDTIEKSSGIIKIPDCEPGVFQEFLRYLYTGKVKKVPKNNVLELYVVADKYDAQDLKKDCVKFMAAHISLENICDVLIFALRYNATELLQSATNLFEKNVRKIIVTPEWISFLKDYPVEANELHIKALDYLHSREK